VAAASGILKVRSAMEDASKRGRIAAAIISFAFSGILSSAWADDQSVPKPSEPKDDLAEFVVTGSRIRRPELDRLQPTTVQNSAVTFTKP
jgi:hypothetical protein